MTGLRADAAPEQLALGMEDLDEEAENGASVDLVGIEPTTSPMSFNPD